MKYTNIHALPRSIAQAIENDTYDLKDIDPGRISISQLINPAKIRALTARHWKDIEEDISDSIWRLLGQAVHSVLERAEHHQSIIEERLTESLAGFRVTGKADLYESEEKTIQDYKVTSAWSLVYKKESDKLWEQQLNTYAWLWRKAGFPVEQLKTIAILRDWSKTKAKQDNSYPQLPIAIISLPLWDEAMQEQFIRARIELHAAAEQLPDDEICVCTPSERWSDADVYAVYKNTNKTATKLCDTQMEAEQFIASCSGDKHKYSIQKRPGIDRRCMEYCNVCQWCNFWKSKYGKEGE